MKPQKINYSKLNNDELFCLLTPTQQWILNSSIASCAIEGFYLNKESLRKLIMSSINGEHHDLNEEKVG